jgi:di/tricarboxylate transporter
MTIDQWIIFGILIVTLILFVSGRWRYDIVALIALLIVTITGIIPVDRAFAGFGSPAVITVAAILVLSKGLQNSGVIDVIGQKLTSLKGGTVAQLAVLTPMIAFTSAFMNNIGALALFLPVVLDLARKKNLQVSTLLMPLAFASLLGGMTTLIGTPPNIIASSYRQQVTGEPFGMFDFTPVGIVVAIAGLLFIILIGWRLIPNRKSSAPGQHLFDIENYITEVRVPLESRLIGKSISEIQDFSHTSTTVISILRENEQYMDITPNTKLQAGDVLVISVDTEMIKNLVQRSGLELVGSKKLESKNPASEDISTWEVVVAPNSMLINNTVRSINLRNEFAVNLLAISRQGIVLRTRIDKIRFKVGDVLLLQGHVDSYKEINASLGCLPLAGRSLNIEQKKKLIPMLVIFLAALLVSSLGWLPIQIAFVAAVVAAVITKVVTLHEAYSAIDWPILILLGAMIPLGEALETTGGAQLIADGLLGIAHHFTPAVSLVIILIATMFLSDLINNAATVVLMAPIGISVATGMQVAIEPYLIAVAIGASCAFLTPIGHQSNTLVMGAGGYKFGDYWRMGIIVELIVVLVSVPLILLIWPFK